MRMTLALLAVVLPQAAPPALPGWHPDVPSGMAEAKKTGRPLMVVFR